MALLPEKITQSNHLNLHRFLKEGKIFAKKTALDAWLDYTKIKAPKPWLSDLIFWLFAPLKSLISQTSHMFCCFSYFKNCCSNLCCVDPKRICKFYQ